ncbi:MAG: 7-cyano-7-deazaguanine synthase QueC [Anaerolineaceae bacterium]|nr:7-cyano-7-deazaguanine synthase QueC [Anaerolineaceae bacterium]
MSALSTEKKTAVVLISGGMDSCVVAALAADRGYNLAMLHINYGQRTEARELVSFNQLATHYNAADRLVANIRYLSAIGGSSLTDSSLHVAAPGEPAIESSKIPLTYVPFRNTHLLAIAASWAETLHAERIMIGIVEEDASGYPDCRKSYVAAMNEVVRLGTRPETKLEIDAPLVDMSKAAIVRLGADLAAPFGLTWSCYRRDDVPCRNCLSCELRARAFAEAQVQDPLLADA